MEHILGVGVRWRALKKGRCAGGTHFCATNKHEFKAVSWEGNVLRSSRRRKVSITVLQARGRCWNSEKSSDLMHSPVFTVLLYQAYPSDCLDVSSTVLMAWGNAAQLARYLAWMYWNLRLDIQIPCHWLNDR